MLMPLGHDKEEEMGETVYTMAAASASTSPPCQPLLPSPAASSHRKEEGYAACKKGRKDLVRSKTKIYFS